MCFSTFLFLSCCEQQRIVAKLDALIKYCDDLEATIKESQQQNELLLQQVLHEALELGVEQTAENDGCVFDPADAAIGLNYQSESTTIKKALTSSDINA